MLGHPFSRCPALQLPCPLWHSFPLTGWLPLFQSSLSFPDMHTSGCSPHALSLATAVRCSSPPQPYMLLLLDISLALSAAQPSLACHPASALSGSLAIHGCSLSGSLISLSHGHTWLIASLSAVPTCCSHSSCSVTCPQVVRHHADSFISEIVSIYGCLTSSLPPDMRALAPVQLEAWQRIVEWLGNQLKFRTNLASRHDVIGWLVELYLAAVNLLLSCCPLACSKERLSLTHLQSKLNSCASDRLLADAEGTDPLPSVITTTWLTELRQLSDAVIVASSALKHQQAMLATQAELAAQQVSAAAAVAAHHSTSNSVAEDISRAIAQALKRGPQLDLRPHQPRSRPTGPAAASGSGTARMPDLLYKYVCSQGFCIAFIRHGLGLTPGPCTKHSCHYKHEAPSAEVLAEYGLTWQART